MKNEKELSSESEQTPALLFPPATNFECINCGQCCSIGWLIVIDPLTREKLIETDFYKDYVKSSKQQLLSEDEKSGLCTVQSPLGICSMRRDNRCLIHSKLGNEFKPFGCRRFPFYFYPTPDGIYIGLAFTCVSILMNTGKPNETYTSYIRNLLKEQSVSLPKKLQVKIHDNLTTDWEGYRLIENIIYYYIEISRHEIDFGYSMWEAMMMIIMLIKSSTEKGKQHLSVDEIQSFFSTPQTFPVNRNTEYREKEFNYSKNLISWFETNAYEYCEGRFEELVTGGVFTSRILGESYSLDEIRKYKEENPAHWKREEILYFLAQMTWRKDLLAKDSVLTGIVLMNLMYPFFDWYFYLSAMSRKEPHPEIADAKYSISVLERNIKHDHTKKPETLARNFCKSLNILP
jgi:Fe-S-cluster containining protein